MDGRSEGGSAREGAVSDRWSRIETLFLQAIELAGEERTRFLNEATGTDPDLRGEVESLLAEYDRDPSFLDAPPPWLEGLAEPPGPRPPDPPEDLPERIDGYCVVKLLGRGGMGRVYLAEREAPGFRRLVALKVMRRGIDTDDVIARFNTERQILATLDHPHIARLLDVGATEDGLPYFVMEHVEGEPILDYCDRLRLPVAARLELFRSVASAVHHAHGSLVVHRDIKPGNILVAEGGTPKLLDFGIAKVLDGGPDREVPHTVPERRPLTPEYSSPEQLRGEAITTACDVHALGILLYQLLSGTHPFRSPDGNRIETQRRILELDPPAPSTRVTAVAAAARRSSSDALRRELAGDLDTIVLMALRKEPRARYASALELSRDLERHLEGLPVEARPATVGYRLGKFLNRHRRSVAAASTAFLLLAGFGIVTATQAERIRQTAEQVTLERDRALAVRGFLLETFGSTGPDLPTGQAVTVREVLDRRAATLDDAYRDDPVLRAELTGVLAEAYQRLGLFADAEPLARRALEEQRQLHGPAHAEVAVALNSLGWILHRVGNMGEAVTTLEEAVAVGRTVFPPEGDGRLARALNDLGVVNEALGEYDRAAEFYRESLDVRERLGGEGQLGIATTSSNLAVIHYRRGQLDEAAAKAERSVEAFDRAVGPDHDRTLVALGNLAAIRSVQGDHAGAAETYAKILERHRRVLGDRHFQVAYAMKMKGTQLSALDRHTEAETLLREAVSIELEALGPEHVEVARSLRPLGQALNAQGRYEEGLGHLDTALEIFHSHFGGDHRESATVELHRARAQMQLGRLDEAEDGFREALRAFRVSAGDDHRLTTETGLELAELLLASGREDEALPLLTEFGQSTVFP